MIEESVKLIHLFGIKVTYKIVNNISRLQIIFGYFFKVSDLKKQYNGSNNVQPKSSGIASTTTSTSNSSSNVAKETSKVSKETSRKRSLSSQQQNDDATLLRHSADDEDEGDEEVKYQLGLKNL